MAKGWHLYMIDKSAKGQLMMKCMRCLIYELEK